MESQQQIVYNEYRKVKESKENNKQRANLKNKYTEF